MARKAKKLFDRNGTEVRELGYYSTPNEVANFIQERLLEINPYISRVLDPAVGKEELIAKFIQKGIEVDGFDIYRHLKRYNCNFIKGNFIDYIIQNMGNSLLVHNELNYNAIIMNPPYNCHEVNYIKDNKARLSNFFSDTKVLNMYSIFMDIVITYSKQDTLIGMIVSDSFMTAKMHAKLRQKIIEHCKIYDIIMCPNNLFWEQKADVRTCILILKKTSQNNQNSRVRVMNRQYTLDQFYLKLRSRSFTNSSKKKFILNFSKDNHEWLIGVPRECINLFKNKRLGDLYSCITGISTGNDSKYLSGKYNKYYTHAFYKNPGSKKFICEPNHYLITDYLLIEKRVKNFIVRNKSFIGKEGITCSSMGVVFSACYLPAHSTFGVNPNIFPDSESLYWLLAYLNSDLVTFLIRSVLIRSNMITSGYVSRLPILNFDDDMKCELTNLSISAMKNVVNIPKFITRINTIVFSAANLSEPTIAYIKAFTAELTKNV